MVTESKEESAVVGEDFKSDPGQAQVSAAQRGRSLVGETLAGRYTIEGMAGRGGMGTVYKGTQLALDRPVAIKLLDREHLVRDPQFRRRFFLEAATTARLTHPNTITVFDYGETSDGDLFIAMELLVGRTLSQVLRLEGAMDEFRALKICIQICRALREAHQEGVIHRDLKPGNVMLVSRGDEEEFVKVLDFGLVKLFDPGPEQDNSTDLGDGEVRPSGPGEHTKAGTFLGTPKYMSPEQIKSEAIDQRTDIYAMGTIMYSLLTGRAPFLGETEAEILYRQLHEAPPEFSAIDPLLSVSGASEALVRECLAKDRDQRPRSMAEVIVQLKRILKRMRPDSGFSEPLAHLADGDTGPSEASRSRSVVFDSVEMEASESVGASGKRRPSGSWAVAPQDLLSQSLVSFSGEASSAFDTVDTEITKQGGRGVIDSWRWSLPLVALLSLGAMYWWNRPATPNPVPSVQQKVPVRTAVKVTSEPPGAEIFLAGVPVGKAPLELGVDAQDTLALEAKLAGHISVTREVSLQSVDGALHFEMIPDAKPSPDDIQADFKDNPYE